MATDVLASGVRTSTGQFQNQAGANLRRTRVKAIYLVPTATAGSLVFRDGGSSGTIKLTLNTIVSASNVDYIELPGEGMLFETDVHVTMSNIASVMVFYG